MIDGQGLVILGGVLVVTQATVAVGVGAIRDYLSGRNGKVCNFHHALESKIDALIDAYKEEKQFEMMSSALAEALRRNEALLEKHG